MRKILLWTLTLALVLVAPVALAADNATIDLLLSGYATKAFTDEAVAEEDINTILAAGAQAPSAGNLQPWHFTVIQNADIAKGFVAEGTSGTVLIVVSAATEVEVWQNPSFDCGQAMQNMVVAAQALGLGSHIYGSPVASVAEQSETLGIPEGFAPAMVILIGYEGDPDAVSSASPRNAIADISNFVK